MDLFREILRVHAEGQACVVATIVHTQGSIPSHQSSRMLVRQDGSMAGTVGGGCVEADVWAAAKEMLGGGNPRKLTFNLNADPRYDAGLTCGGTLEVHLDAITPETPIDIFKEAVRLAEQDQKFVLATVTDAPPAESALQGTKLIVRDNGSLYGDSGAEELNSAVAQEAASTLAAEKPRMITLQTESGTVGVALEPFLPVPRCILLGAGHVAQHVSRIASLAGFRISVADDRAQYSNRERFPDADEIVSAEWEEIFERITPGGFDYLVIVTRGHKEDMTVLRWAVLGDARYIGLIGSRRKVLSIYSVLEEEGVPREKLERVHAPIGVEIGALTPEEIAVSIVAELVAVRRGAPLDHAKTLGRDLKSQADSVAK